MATVPSTPRLMRNGYPTSDGKPMAETDTHRDLMSTLIETLKAFYQADPRVYVSGNLLIFYEPRNKRRHISPDVFVVKGVPKQVRPNYLVWEEGKGPDIVIELTSSSTRQEDVKKKFDLYQNTLKVKEYFLFDPLGDYLDLPLRGYRLRAGNYHPIRKVNGRLPSQVLGLHLERDGNQLRLYDPSTQQRLPTPQEAQQRDKQARQQAEQARQQAEQAQQQAEQAQRQAEQAQQRAEAETERLRRENEELRRRMSEGN